MGSAAYQLLEEIGVDFKALQDAGESDYLLSNAAAPFAIYLNADQYGKDQIVAGPWGEAMAGAGEYRAMIESLNLSADDKARLFSLITGKKDYLTDIPLQDKDHYLRSTSYARFLRDRVGLSPGGCKLTEPYVSAVFGVGIESLSIMQALGLGPRACTAWGCQTLSPKQIPKKTPPPAASRSFQMAMLR